MDDRILVKRIAAFDVGQSTGIAICDAIIGAYKTPELRYLSSFTQEGIPPYNADTFVRIFDDSDLIVVEYPQPNNFSSGIRKTLRIADCWSVLLDPLVKKGLVQIVLPGTWKTSTARTYNVLEKVPAFRLARERQLTDHEIDAVRMIYWGAVQLKRKIFQA